MTLPQKSEPQQNTGRWVLLATITASSMAFIDSSALNVALPALQTDFKADGAQLLWVINAYLLMLASLILLGGSLGDHYGRNRIFRIGIIVFSAASLACGLAPNIGFLIAARVVQGIGGALMVPGSLAILSASFGDEARGQAIGTWSAFGTITTILAPALGGFLAGRGLWRGVFYINLPLAVLAIYALSKVPETKDEEASPQLDYLGTALIIVGLAALTYGTISLGGSSNAGTSNSVPLIALVVGIVALIAFVFVESRIAHPIVPLALFKNRSFSGTNLMTVFLYGALSGALLFLPLNLIQVQGYDAGIAGLTLLPFSIVLAGLSIVTGRLISRVGPRILLTIGPIIVGIAFLLLSRVGLTRGPDDYWTTFFPVVIVFGVGMGITVAPLTTTVMGSVPTHEAGVASGINNALTRSAQGLAVAIMGAVALFSFTNNLSAQLAQRELTPDVQQQIHQNASKLGGTDIPDGLTDAAHTQAKQAIQAAFVDMFQLVTIIGAVLCFLSALAAALLVEGRKSPAAQAVPASPA